jgi:hypothetical protein
MIQRDKKCFVCENTFSETLVALNTVVNLFVCHDCKGTDIEKQKEAELLDSLAEGFVCGCI